MKNFEEPSTVEPEERYDHNANNVTGSYPIDWENDLVPIGIWRKQANETARLREENVNYWRKQANEIVKLREENVDYWNWKQEVQRLLEVPIGMDISQSRVRELIEHLKKKANRYERPN